ncbi:hypothetical protein JCGZ_23562 [Jatropha curcas]|uniref:Gnk2-homologous domain-containing protein n=1 Tax=Jatropha curcas TaxID=180498 RepID=A0A067JW46_JATCU|nr:plasmodesmata-located protein 2 [Jatropha curcas]KDP23729.1 hypothetical protein JCGZ_23562 [Jatropha curcas]
MDSILKPIPLVTFILFLTFIKASSLDYYYTSLVYTKCANQTHEATSHSQVLSSLFQELSAQSSRSKFFKTTSGDEKVGISGLFQCRGDLSNNDCHNCVNKIPELSNSTCKKAVAARLQLNGCYFYYETDGFGDEIATTERELLHEKCSEKKAVSGGFLEVRDAALLAMENGEMINDKGFYEMDYEFVHVIVQCENDYLGGCDCIECIGNAVEIVKEDCGSSFSGQVYLDKCFLSYSYHPDGKQSNFYPGEEEKNGKETGKTVAMVLGGAVALLVGFILLKFKKTICQKDDDI